MTTPDPTTEAAAAEALAAVVTDAVVEVLTDRTYDTHAADNSLWNETVDHLRLVIADALRADRAEQRVEGGHEALVSVLHPELGSGWDRPDGVLWKAYQDGQAEGARMVREQVEALAASWDAKGRALWSHWPGGQAPRSEMLAASHHNHATDLRAALAPVPTEARPPRDIAATCTKCPPGQHRDLNHGQLLTPTEAGSGEA